MKVNRDKEARLSHEYLLSILDYNPETGLLKWKIDKGPNAMIGYTVNGLGPDLYSRIRINGYTYLVHRVIWFYVHSKWPTGTIDHIDQNRQNNRISNLRDVTYSVNNHNAKMRGDNTSGVKGVSYDQRDRRWRAYIQVNNKNINLGSFIDYEMAVKARKQAEAQYDLGGR